MKLNDIDTLVAHRQQYIRRAAELAAASQYTPSSVLCGPSRSISDSDIMCKVAALLREEVKIKYEEAKTRLMMLGVDEFTE